MLKISRILLKSIASLILMYALSACASGQLDLYNAQGKKVGECTAGYEWHLYGVEDSVDWLLNWCVEKAIEEGIDVASVSDNAVIEKDYSYPEPTTGTYWTKKNAWLAFDSDVISEKQYGYILAAIENQFYIRNRAALKKFESGEINESEYQALLAKSKSIFYGE